MVILKMSNSAKKGTGKKILFIVEGETDEPDFLNKVREQLFQNYDIEYYTYNTSIHDLIDGLCPDGEFCEDFDLKLTLKSMEKDEEKRKKLEGKYTDVFLIFDMEPHYQKQHYDSIKKMLQFYTDSSGEGKLYINYPMMQSYKHVKTMPDLEFKDKKVTLEEVKRYKQLVGDESEYQHLSRYDFKILLSLCAHHLMKLNYVLTGKYAIPTVEQFESFKYDSLLEHEVKQWKEENRVDVLNTSILWILEFTPRYIDSFIQHRDTFLI